MLSRLLIALAFLWTGLAQASVPVTIRYDWFHSGGYFHKVQGGGGGWAETLNAAETFYFVETARNDVYVELFDASRDMRVRLNGHAMQMKAHGETQFHDFYQGRWDDRRLFGYTPADGHPAYLNLYTAEIWRWSRNGSPIVYLREILRNDDQIQLYNAGEGYTISLMNGEMWMKVDGHAWFKYTGGAWN